MNTSSHEPDLYAILDVDPAASSEQITHAYRVLLRRLHPDTAGPAPLDLAHDQPSSNEDRLRQVLAAYAVLHDPDRRAHYDRNRQGRPTNPPRPSHRPSRPASVPDPAAIVIGTLNRHRSAPDGIIPLDSPSAATPAHTDHDMLRLLRAVLESLP